jgi:hypothetical protein
VLSVDEQYNLFLKNKFLFIVFVISKWILERWDGVDWIDKAQDRDQWRALVNTVLNLRVP